MKVKVRFSLAYLLSGCSGICCSRCPVWLQEALESAMSSGLWGHALFLASRMDSRSYTNVLNR